LVATLVLIASPLVRMCHTPRLEWASGEGSCMGLFVLVALGVLLLVAAAVGTWAAVMGLRRALEGRLAATDEELRRLGDASLWGERGAGQMRQEIASFHGALDALRAREEERRAREEQSWAVLHKLAAVLTGGHRTGRAGENVLRESLSHLPPSMVVSNFRVNGKVVEFGLVLPDGRRLPIDSKWPAERELQALAASTDPDERERLVRVIERTVADRAREVGGYRDPSVTTAVGVAAVPDAAYEVLRRAHSEAYRQGVIVIPYSMALPVVLFLHSLVSRFGMAGDVEACMSDLARILDSMENTLENKVARASAMLVNGSEELRGHVGKARTTVARGLDSGAGAQGNPTKGLVSATELDADEDIDAGGEDLLIEVSS
jgi:RmuC family